MIRVGNKFVDLTSVLKQKTTNSGEFGSRPIGIELELEGINQFLSDQCSGAQCWVPTQDNSLYYQGVELISRNNKLSEEYDITIPIAGVRVDQAFKELSSMLLKYAKVVSKYNNVIKRTPRTSERTSNHVHIGVLDFGFKQLKELYLNYLIFEPLLFSIVEGRRSQNIFCYPSDHQAVVESRLATWPADDAGLSHLSFFTGSFHKYEAFNMRAVAEKGTVEFRLNGGAYNANAIKHWVKILLALVEYQGPHYWDLWPVMNYARLLKYAKLVFGDLVELDHSIAPRMYEAYANIKHHLIQDDLVDNEIVLNKFLLRVVKESKKVPKCVE